MGAIKIKMKKIIYWVYVAIVLIPFIVIVFFLGGIDAVTGTRLYPKFRHIIEKICARFDYD